MGIKVVSEYIYIMTKLNELAVLHGVHPGHLSAQIRDSDDLDSHVLEFSSEPTDHDQFERLQALRKTIGCEADETDIGDSIELIDRIDAAIRKAQARGRSGR